MKRKRALPSSSRVDAVAAPMTPVPVSDPGRTPPKPTSRAPTLEFGPSHPPSVGDCQRRGGIPALPRRTALTGLRPWVAPSNWHRPGRPGVVAAGAAAGDTAVGSSEADARNALALFTDLGVVDVPVSR